MSRVPIPILLLAGCAPGPLPGAIPESAPQRSVASPTLPSPPATKEVPSAQPRAAKVAPVEAPAPEEPVVPELLDTCTEPRRIVVHKAARQVELRCGDALAARFDAGLGFEPQGDKHHEGDGRTPEGDYYITSKYISSFHRSLQLSYPNVADADRGLAEGRITKRQHASIVRANALCQLPPQTTPLGSLLQIHGGGSGADWTLGCVALENEAIEIAFRFHQPGCRGGKPRTVVTILP